MDSAKTAWENSIRTGTVEWRSEDEAVVGGGNKVVLGALPPPEGLRLTIRLEGPTATKDKSGLLDLGGHQYPSLRLESTGHVKATNATIETLFLGTPGEGTDLLIENRVDHVVVDGSGRTSISISGQAPGSLRHLEINSEAKVGIVQGSSEIERLTLHAPLALVRQLTASSLHLSGDLLELRSGSLRVPADAVPDKTSCVLKSGASLHMLPGTGRIPAGLTFDLGGGVLALEVDEIATDWIVTGPGRVDAAKRVEGLAFELDRDGGRTALRLNGGHVATNLRGTFALHAEPGSHCAGSLAEGIVVSPLREGDGIELEQVNLYQVAVADLPAYRRAERLIPWWPSTDGGIDRRACLRRARAATGPVEPAATTAQAHVWSVLAEKLKTSGASGLSQAIAHEIAADSRRRSTSWSHHERWLLESYRVFGYGARLGRPLLVWALATVATVLVVGLLGGVFSLGGTQVRLLEFGRLAVDVLIAPVSFVRSIPTSPDLEAAVAAGGATARLVAFAGRVVATMALVYLGLAIRRVARVE